MHALRRFLPTLMLLGALVVILVTLFTDHKSEYGQVKLPQGGVVTLPAGSAKVFVIGGENAEDHNLPATLSFQAVPVEGGQPLVKEPTGSEGTPDELATRSQSIGSAGAVADIEIPSAGQYAVSGQMGEYPATLSFGETPFSAVLGKWMIWVGLLAAAFLISLIPVDRVGRRSGSGTAHGQGPAAPVDGSGISSPPPYTPYGG
jgi:hypothetical protein